MCTNFVLIKKKGVAELSKSLKIDDRKLTYGDFRPGSHISIVKETNRLREVLDARWWLYLQQTQDGLKPHPKFFSVNTNHAKLKSKPEYKTSRCIILASAFVESQGGKNPHLLEPSDESAIAFGGLYKEWTDRVTGEIVHSASIITLPGHPALVNIHKKSTPLWLPAESFDDWLNSELIETEKFDHILKPELRASLIATPIDKVMSKKPINEPFIIEQGSKRERCVNT